MRKIYKPSTPRLALALMSVVTATITMGAMVVLPARLEFLEPEPYAAAATKTVTSIDVGANLGDCADEPRSGGDDRTLDMHVLATEALARKR